MKFQELHDQIKHILESGANDTRLLEMCLQLFRTGAEDITGREIRLGDIVVYDFTDNTSSFEVIFEDGAFRKLYDKWENGLPKPILESGWQAKNMRFKIVSSRFYK